MFRLRLDIRQHESLAQQARAQIVSALHLGRLVAGDRLPSVRSLSRTCGIDPKTALRIYHALAAEGYIQLRPGSGAYLKEIAASLLDQSQSLGLLKMVRKHVTLAEQLDIAPEAYRELVTRYVDGRGGKRWGAERLAFIECNREQTDVISEELSRRLQVQTEPILLHAALHPKPATLARAQRCRYLVTTDFHFAALGPFARRLGKALLCVRLDPKVIESILDLASRGTLGMIVTDTSFLLRFRRSLMRLGLDARAAKRIDTAAISDVNGVRSLIASADALYVSPLCAAKVDGLVPHTVPVLRPRAHLSTDSLESIEAMLMFGNAEGAPLIRPRRDAAPTARTPGETPGRPAGGGRGRPAS